MRECQLNTRPMVAMPAVAVMPASSALIGVDRNAASSGAERYIAAASDWRQAVLKDVL